MWQFPLLPHTVIKLPRIVLAPISLTNQQAINEQQGAIVPKE
jgi:hypothetical protein